MHLSQRLGPEWNDNIMEQLVKALGVSGSRTLRLMLDGARRSLVVE